MKTKINGIEIECNVAEFKELIADLRQIKPVIATNKAPMRKLHHRKKSSCKPWTKQENVLVKSMRASGKSAKQIVRKLKAECNSMRTTTAIHARCCEQKW